MTTDSVSKQVVVEGAGWTIGGSAPAGSVALGTGCSSAFLRSSPAYLFGLVLLALSLLAPAKFEQIRGAALDATGPIASSLHEVTSTVEGLGTGAGDYWDAVTQNGKLKRERAAMFRRMVEARAIFQGISSSRLCFSSVSTRVKTIAVGRIVGSSFNSPRRFAILRRGTRDGVQVGMPVHAADGLVGRVIDAGAVGVAGTVGLGSRQHRYSAAIERRHAGDCPRPRRRRHRCPSARSRPQSVSARRHHHDLGHRWPYPPLVPSPGDEAPGRRSGGRFRSPIGRASASQWLSRPIEPAAAATDSQPDQGAP